MAFLPRPTIVRIKRRLGTESSETIIVSSKRKKVDVSDSMPEPTPEICTTIMNKLTTLKEVNCLEVETRKALESETKHSWDLKENYKKGFHTQSKDLIQKKSRSDVAAIRFKLICSKRNLKDKECDALDFNIFDALKEKEETPSMPLPSSSVNSNSDVISCNGVPMDSEKVEFVYDLYYTSLPLELSSWINNICEIQKFNALDYREPNSKSDIDEDDDDDENSESNWRNDYPEEEEEEDAKYDDEDEDDFLCGELTKKANLGNSSEDSFDVDDYDDSGDFDEDGNLITLYNKNPESVFGRYKKGKLKIRSDEDESDSDD